MNVRQMTMCSYCGFQESVCGSTEEEGSTYACLLIRQLRHIAMDAISITSEPSRALLLEKEIIELRMVRAGE